jgi:SPP1 gp7 family putative phage head morphogenesis protein
VVLAYKAWLWGLLDKLNAKILAKVLPAWEKKQDRTDAGPTYGTRSISGLDLEVEEIFDPQDLAGQIDILASRVSKKGQLEFVRVIGISTRETGIAAQLDDFRDQNVDLVKSLAKTQLADLDSTLAQADAGAWRVEELAKELQTRFNVSKSKASLLANDQTLKLNGQLARTRQQNAGITKYIWTTSRDERVRESHAELDGQTFSYDDPPITSPDGRRGHPGDDFQCRCTAFPVLPELDEADPGSEIFDTPAAPPEPEPIPEPPPLRISPPIEDPPRPLFTPMDQDTSVRPQPISYDLDPLDNRSQVSYNDQPVKKTAEYVVVQNKIVVNSANTKAEAHRLGQALRRAGQDVSVFKLSDYVRYIDPSYVMN